MDYRRFESLIFELERLLTDDGAKVFLNQKVRDQFTGNLRQVDIVIDRDGHRTCVECRAHRPKQDVKWIEELVGRADSIGADEIIGASLSGFTGPAVKMAKARGISLRDLSEINPDDVAGWGKRVEISYRYCVFSRLEANINLLPQYRFNQFPDVDQARKIFSFISDQQGFLSCFGDAISKAEKLVISNGLDRSRTYQARGRVFFGGHIIFEDVFISSVDFLVSFKLASDIHLSTCSRIYRDPRVESFNPLASISLFDGNDWSVLRSPFEYRIFIDCNDFNIHDRSMVCVINISGLEPGSQFKCTLENPIKLGKPEKSKTEFKFSYSYTPIEKKTDCYKVLFGGEEIAIFND